MKENKVLKGTEEIIFSKSCMLASLSHLKHPQVQAHALTDFLQTSQPPEIKKTKKKKGCKSEKEKKKTSASKNLNSIIKPFTLNSIYEARFASH